MPNMKTKEETKEQIQEDILTYLEGYWAFTPYGEKMKTDLCQIVVDNFEDLA